MLILTAASIQLLLLTLSDDLQIHLHSYWLDVLSLVTLDIAVSSKTVRPYWMKLLRSLRSTFLDNMDHSASSLMWLTLRGICSIRVQMKVETWRVPGCDLSLLQTADLLHLGLDGNSRVTDECIQKALTGCDQGCQDLRENKNVRSASVSASS